ncbi:MAG: class I SAM-dependent methyltransferase, partial [Chloroflexota bacterium]|nr:class I SAM-dependent methyltransferase [Chloroflexota bacterium]
MEAICGKRTYFINRDTLRSLASRYQSVAIDLGTGDGRYVRHVAGTVPNCLALGIDACRENLRDTSRRASANALYLIANALDLPIELAGLATRITINFPWGSLLAGLLDGHPGLLAGLGMISTHDAVVEAHLNAGALDEQGWLLASGAEQIRLVLGQDGWEVPAPLDMSPDMLQGIQTTWARRLAWGRDPR